MSIKDELLKQLARFDGLPWSEELEREVRQEVLIFLASKGLYPKHLGISLAADGYIEIDADDYVPTTEVN